MSIACCDGSQLPQADQGAKKRLQEPNHLTIKGGQNARNFVEVSHASWLIPLQVSTGRIFAYPAGWGVWGTSAVTAKGLEDAYSNGFGVFLPGPGRWNIFLDSSVDLECKLVDAFSDAAALLVKPEGYTHVAHTTATAGATSTGALAENALRRYALIVNDSVSTVWLMMGAAAVANQGIRLNAAGGSYEIYGPHLWRGAVNCIAGSAGNNLVVTEGT